MLTGAADKKSGAELGYEYKYGIRPAVLRLSDPCGRGFDRAAKKGVRLLAQDAIRCVVPDAQGSRLLAYCPDLRIPDGRYFYREHAGAAAVQMLRRTGMGHNVCGVIFAGRTDMLVKETLNRLLADIRYPVMCCPRQDDAYCEALAREFGVPVVNRLAGSLQKAERVEIEFCPEDRTVISVITPKLFLRADGMIYPLPYKMNEQDDKRYRPGDVAAALAECRVLNESAVEGGFYTYKGSKIGI